MYTLSQPPQGMLYTWLRGLLWFDLFSLTMSPIFLLEDVAILGVRPTRACRCSVNSVGDDYPLSSTVCVLTSRPAYDLLGLASEVGEHGAGIVEVLQTCFISSSKNSGLHILRARRKNQIPRLLWFSYSQMRTTRGSHAASRQH